MRRLLVRPAEGAPADLVARLRASTARAPAPAAPAPAPADAPAAGAPAARRTLRVDLERLDRMLRLSGEVAVTRRRLRRLLDEPGSESREAALQACWECEALDEELQELVARARMVPLGPVLRQQVRTLHDAAESVGRRARLVLEGEDVELDTAIAEHLRDPLTHLVRNAVAHGIEPEAARLAAGKPAMGTVTVRAYHEAGSVFIEVADDGAGLDRARVADRARRLGLLADGVQPSDADLQRFLFEPGFTTAQEVSSASGRGVGLDAVRRDVEALRGAVSVHGETGRGLTIVLRLPLTLAVVDGFAVEVAGDIHVLPVDMVVECIEPPAAMAPGRRGVVERSGRLLPCVRLRDLFLVPGAPAAREAIVIVRSEEGEAGLVVDALAGEMRAVMKPLAGALAQGVGLSGSTVLADGRVGLVLDAPALLRQAMREARAAVAGAVEV
jgi:two-component system chemotaxis sensor kinase CheA